MNSSHKNAADDIVNLMKALPQKQQVKPQSALNAERVKWGLILGVIIGLLSGIFFQVFHLWLARIPAQFDLALWLINLLVFGMIGLTAGGLCALPVSYFYGSLFSGIVLAMGTRIWILVNHVPVFYNYIAGETYWAGDLLHFLLFSWWAIPGAIALRWVIESATEKLTPISTGQTRQGFWLLILGFSLLLGFMGSSPKF